ncbi:MAG: hypothetical protein HY290_12665 [Planctomycetia bacterium]|nr:hypothetical protein [Planctomycetia bacterium]
MARREADREDLMAEATALRERAELVVEGCPEPIVAGFRDGGNWSVYFGADPVYHFDPSGALRRAFAGGHMYRSQGQTLARLNRSRTDTAVDLVRHDLEPGELAEFLSTMELRLADLKSALDRGTAVIVRRVPENFDVEARLIIEIEKSLQKQLSNSIKKR